MKFVLFISVLSSMVVLNTVNTRRNKKSVKTLEETVTRRLKVLSDKIENLDERISGFGL